ncbi:MAG: FG-GAP repeat protein [Rickettsiaceae bacterium]
MKKYNVRIFSILMLPSLMVNTVTAESFNNEADYQQTSYIKAANTDANDLFGNSVSVSGNLLIVGSSKEASNSSGVDNDPNNNLLVGSGAAYIFTLNNDNEWLQDAYLKASNPDINDGFGFSVAASGNTVVIGAPFEASNATTINGNQDDNTAIGSGAVYVFAFVNNNWIQQAYLKADNAQGFDNFGHSVAISGNTIVVGAIGEASNAIDVDGDGTNNDGFLNGAAYVFHRTDFNWTQQAYLKPSNSDQSDQFGYSVAISGDTIIVGAPNEDGDGSSIDNNSIDASGAAYIFRSNNSDWSQTAYLKASNIGENDQFGHSVAISNNVVVVGARFEGSNASGVDGDQDNNLSLGSGAAYVYSTPNGKWTQTAYLKSTNNLSNSFFGSAVSVDNHKIAVGNDSNQSTGNVDLYLYENDTWQTETILSASNLEAGDRFGSAVSISANKVAVGSYRESSDSNGINGDEDNNNAFSSGAAYIFTDIESIFSNGFEIN